MNTINRRALVAGIAALTATTAVTAEARPYFSASIDHEPEPDIIPGLADIQSVLITILVRRHDNAVGGVGVNITNPEFAKITHLLDDGDMEAIVELDALASLPTWLQRELGYAAIAATKGTPGAR